MAPVAAGHVPTGLEPGVVAGLADRQRGEVKAQGGEGGSEQKGGRAQSVRLGEVAGEQSGDRDGAVTGSLVETHREATIAAGRQDRSSSPQ